MIGFYHVPNGSTLIKVTSSLDLYGTCYLYAKNFDRILFLFGTYLKEARIYFVSPRTKRIRAPK